MKEGAPATWLGQQDVDTAVASAPVTGLDKRVGKLGTHQRLYPLVELWLREVTPLDDWRDIWHLVILPRWSANGIVTTHVQLALNGDHSGCGQVARLV